MTLGNLSRCH